MESVGLGVNLDGRYTLAPEAEVLRAISLCGWLGELRSGDAELARDGAARAVERWLDQGLRHSRRDGTRFLDVGEVLNHCVLQGRRGGDPTWDRFLGQARGLALEFREPEGFGLPAVDDLGRHGPARIHLTMRRDFNLEGRPPGSGLRLRIPLPYDDPAQEDLRIETSVPSGDQVLVRRARESLEVRMPESSAPLGELTLGVDVTARVHQVRRPVDAGLVEPYDRVSADYALYTRSTEGLIQLTPEVRRAAAEAAGRLENPWLVVEAIWDWLCDRMILNTVHLTELDPVDPLGWVLRHRWCDCFVGSALFVALCRARGLPARVVGGVCLYSAIGFSHYWAEVLIPPFGWVPMDTTSWSLAAGEGSASPWAMFFRGRIDYRLRMECWPKVVTGPIGIKYPAEWYLVQTFERGETVVTYHEVPTGRWLYRDRLRVKLAPAPV